MPPSTLEAEFSDIYGIPVDRLRHNRGTGVFEVRLTARERSMDFLLPSVFAGFRVEVRPHIPEPHP